MRANDWATPVISLGPAVISRIGSKPGDYYENIYPSQRFATPHLMIQIAGANAGQCGVLEVLGSANLKRPLGSSILGLQLRPSSPVWTSSSTPPDGSRQSPRLPMAGRR